MSAPLVSGEIQYVFPDGKLTFLGIALLQDIAAIATTGAVTVTWGGIAGSIVDQSDLQAALNGKASVTHNHSYPTLDDLPTLGTAAAADVGDFAAALHGHTQAEVLDLVADLAAKQAALVSGTNIKTINGATILGAGDIVVSGGGIAGTATLTLPGWRMAHTQTIAAIGVTPASVVFATLGAFAATDANNAEFLDVAAISAAPGTDQITITMAFGTPATGPIPINWSAI